MMVNKIKKPKAAIIGPGKIAGCLGALADIDATAPRTHAHALIAEGFEITAVAGPTEAETAKFATRWGINHTANTIDELHDAGPFDLVVIAAPDATHATLIQSVIQKIRPQLVITEKPLCMSADELSLINTAVEAQSTTLIVNQSHRLSAAIEETRAHLNAGALGQPLMSRWSYYGGWQHNGVHLVDIVRHIFGDVELVSVREGWLDREGDRCLDVRLRASAFPDIVIEIESFPETAYQVSEGEVYLDKGRIRLTDFLLNVHIDRPVKNAAQEVELLFSETLDLSGAATPMQKLYTQSRAFLTSGDDAIIRNLGLEVIKPTMELLFEARQRHRSNDHE